MNYVESFNLLGVEAKQIPCINGDGVPAETTEGAIGCFYMDTITGKTYKCIDVTDGAYIWVESLDENDKRELQEEIALCLKGEKQKGANLCDESKAVSGSWWYGNGGTVAIETNQSTGNYEALEADVEGCSTVTFCAFGLKTDNWGNFYNYYFVDENYNQISTAITNMSGDVDSTFTVAVPDVAKKILFNYVHTTGHTFGSNFNIAVFSGSERLPYEPYRNEVVYPEIEELREDLSAEINEAKEIATNAEQSAALAHEDLDRCLKGEIQKSTNLCDESVVATGSWWVGKVGSEIQHETNQYTSAYYTYEADVTGCDKITMCSFRIGDASITTTLYNWFAIDEDGKVISTEIIRDYGTYRDGFTQMRELPEGTVRVCVNVQSTTPKEDWVFAVFEGSERLPYEPYGNEVVYPNIEELHEEIESLKESFANIVTETAPRIILPDRFHAVVGDTLQLFYRGMIEHPNPYIYNIEAVCDIGKNTSRYFEVTPNTAQIGEHMFTLNVRDCADNIIASAQCVIEVVNVATSPTAEKNVLCVGDSLTAGGVWVNEFHRRLTSTNGNPVGDGLANINFIGTCKRTEAQYPALYEGYGGWTWASYLNAPSETTSDVWVYCTHDKADADQHSIWQDDAGNLWSLETIEEGRIKFTRHNGHTGTMPDGGVLTHSENATNTGNIAYTSIQIAGGNPFWNTETDSVDFAAYCTRNGFSGIDIVYTLLTWNGGMGALHYNTQKYIDKHVNDAKTFFRTLHSQYPNAKAMLMGIQLPSLNGGCGANYGASVMQSNTYGMCRCVFELNKAYQELANDAEFSGYVEFVNVSAQFDSENNMPQAEKPVNTRQPDIKEMVGTNGVHPTWQGYWQIADAAYRAFMS